MKTRSSFLAATILFVALALTPALASAQSNADLHGGAFALPTYIADLVEAAR